MKIEFVYFVILWLNAFSVKSGISQTISPRELLMRWCLDYKKHCRVQPGTYCEVHSEPVPTNTMAWWAHEAIALGPTGNLQGSVKFYCINTGQVLKRCSFTPMPMPDRVIKRVNKIVEQEGQGRTFRFLNQQKQSYEWTDEVPDDDDDFQGLLEDEVEAAPYPDISAELPGVELDKEEQEFQTILDKPEPDFRDMAAVALHNAGIDGDKTIQAGRAQALMVMAAHAVQQGAVIVEADEDELVYEITFNVPDEGLLQMPLGEDRDDTSIPVIALDNNETHDGIQDVRHYLTRARRSVVGNQPYDTYTPRTTFLQLGEVRAHRNRSVLKASSLTRMTREERLLATTTLPMEPTIDDTMHKIDPELCTTSQEEMMVWGCLMTQYNLKPGLRKFGARGVSTAVKELTQLHIMDTWMPLGVSKISREQRMHALSSLMFLKEKHAGDIKG